MRRGRAGPVAGARPAPAGILGHVGRPASSGLFAPSGLPAPAGLLSLAGPLALASLLAGLASCGGSKPDGAQLYRTLRCGACHDPASEAGVARPAAPHHLSRPDAPAPRMDIAGSRLRREWIDSFLGPFPAGRGLPQEQARALATYLEGLRDTVRVPPDGAPPPGDPERGRALYGESQCASCHRIASEGETTGPELSNASRLQPSYVAAVLRAPQSLAPTSEMPELGLTDAQIGDLIAYLGRQALRLE